MTWEQLQAANTLITTTPIKGKNYAEVPQRIKAFRSVYPDGFILTELVSDIDGICMFQARVGFYDSNGERIVLGTGTAYEKESSSFINKTSYIENCETSAVGRALGMAGFGIDVSVASAEEVRNAMENQKPEPDVICPVCKKAVQPVKNKGKLISPAEIVERLGMCKECYKAQPHEG